MRVLSIDFECANTFCYHSIFWAGVILADEGFDRIAEESILFNPQVKRFFVGKSMTFPYTIAELKNYKTFGENNNQLFKYFNEDTILLGHSLHNDINMLLLACKKYNLICPDFKFIDSNIIFSSFIKKNDEYSLKALADHFNLEFNQHDPLEDAKMSLLVVEKICEAENCSLSDFLIKYEIEVGEVKNGLLVRPTAPIISDKSLYKLRKVNEIYRLSFDDHESGEGILLNTVFCFDKDLPAQYNLQSLANEMLAQGAKFTDNPKLATHILTNKKKKDKDIFLKYITLETLFKTLYPERNFRNFKRKAFDPSFDFEKRRTPKIVDENTPKSE